jgi:4-amino-4-deoxy-L-arabinose transferase-like glycosyltransferase
MDRKELAFFAVILFLAVALRLHGIDRPMYGDEADWYKSAKIVVDHSAQWSNTLVSDNPPLGKAVFVAVYALGIGNLRIVSLIFGTATLVLMYLLARRYLGMRAALASLAVLGFSIYHIIASQQIDRDGSMIAFTALLAMYAYFAYVDSKRKDRWALALSVVAFAAATLMRTTMLALILPILAYGWTMDRKRPVASHLISLWPFALGFALTFPAWILLDNALGLNTLTQKTLSHYLEPLGYDLTARALRIVVAAARIMSRLTFPLVLALIISAHYARRQWKSMQLGQRAFLLASFAWTLFGIASAALAVSGDPPRYFMVVLPAIAIVVGFVISRSTHIGPRWAALAMAMTIAYVALLSALNFNEVNLFLAPYAAIGALALAAIYWLIDRDVNRLVAALALMAIATSMFMMTDLRTYDAMRSQSVLDAAIYFNSVGAQNIAESQERTLDLYVSGKVVQYEDVRCVKQDGNPCPASEQTLHVPPGYYVVNFPLKPIDFPLNVGTQFRFNLFDASGVEGCAKVREYDAQGVVVSEIYNC